MGSPAASPAARSRVISPEDPPRRSLEPQRSSGMTSGMTETLARLTRLSMNDRTRPVASDHWDAAAAAAPPLAWAAAPIDVATISPSLVPASLGRSSRRTAEDADSDDGGCAALVETSPGDDGDDRSWSPPAAPGRARRDRARPGRGPGVDARRPGGPGSLPRTLEAVSLKRPRPSDARAPP